MTPPSLRRIDRLISEIQATTLGEVTSALYCRRGHHLTPENLRANRTCKKCHNENQKEHLAAKTVRLERFLPAEPLAKWINRQGQLFEDGMRGLAIHVAANLGKSNWQVIENQLWRVCQPEQLILWSTADKLCVGLGLHATEIYGFDWTGMAA